MESAETTLTSAAPEFPSLLKRTVIIVLLASVVIFTTSNNILVLISFYLEKKLRNTFTFFVANLAVTDFLMGATSMIFYSVNTVMGYWPFGQFICGLWIFFDSVLIGASIFTVVTISVDRYWAVMWSFSYKKYNKKRKSAVIITCIWVLSVIVCLPPVVIDRLERGQPRVCFWDPSQNKAYAYFLSLVIHHLSFVVILFCYIRVCMKMRKQFQVRPGEAHLDRPTLGYQIPRTNMTSVKSSSCDIDSRPKIFQIAAEGPSTSRNVCEGVTIPKRLTKRGRERDEDEDDSRKRIKQEKKIFVTMSCILIAYVICWVPFNVMFTLSFVAPGLVSPSVFTFGFWMTYLNSAFNPLLYAFSNKDFRKVVMRVIKCRYFQ